MMWSEWRGYMRWRKTLPKCNKLKLLGHEMHSESTISSSISLMHAISCTMTCLWLLHLVSITSASWGREEENLFLLITVNMTYIQLVCQYHPQSGGIRLLTHHKVMCTTEWFSLNKLHQLSIWPQELAWQSEMTGSSVFSICMGFLSSRANGVAPAWWRCLTGVYGNNSACPVMALAVFD